MFEKGRSGNPAGRPKGSRSLYSVAVLIDAIETVEAEEAEKRGGRFNYLEHIVRKSLEDGGLAKTILNRLIPVPKKSIDDAYYHMNWMDMLNEYEKIIGRGRNNGDEKAGAGGNGGTNRQ